VSNPVQSEHRSGMAEANGVRLHYRIGGTGDGVVLLHGFPQTSHEWHRVLPVLAERFTVIAPDLRGLGDSDIPASGYDKRTAAEDIYCLVTGLGFDQFHLVGHDIGGMAAYALARAYPQAVRSLAVLDVLLPGFGLEQAVMDCSAQGRGLWHFPFHMALDVPEMLVSGKERQYLAWHHHQFAANPSAISPADIDEYARCYARPGALQAGFGYYRALFEDAAYNQEHATRESQIVKLDLPVLALGGDGGAQSWPMQSLQQVASDVQGGVVERCGHYIPEERPEELVQRLLDHFSRP